jgi:hypothetical protein
VLVLNNPIKDQTRTHSFFMFALFQLKRRNLCPGVNMSRDLNPEK